MFSKMFIDRPKLAVLVISIAISLIGLLCIFRFPIAEYSEVAPPRIKVAAQYPGAFSEVVVETVASVIEEGANGIENLIYFNANNDNN